MLSTLFQFLAAVDPQVQQVLQTLEVILLPILYTLSGAGLVYCGVKFGLKIQHDPENKGTHIRHLVWSVVGCVSVLMAATIMHIVFNKLLGAL